MIIKNVFPSIMKYNLYRYFSSKLYKVTISGLDKYLSNEQLRIALDQLNEVTIHRTDKSTNKNYCHADISSNLEAENLREKLQRIKIMGKSVKVRVKEVKYEDKEILQESYNTFSFSELNQSQIKISFDYVKNFIKKFYIKNLTENPQNIKDLLTQLEDVKSGRENDYIEIIEYKRELFDFEFKINVNNSKHKGQTDQILLPIRSMSLLDQDEKFSNEVAKMKKIFEILEEIFHKLNYDTYNNLKNFGALRNIQIQFLKNSQFLICLMVSMSKITEVDLKILTEAIKYEFKNKHIYDIIFYLAINEKVQGLVCNSSQFYYCFGDEICLNYPLEKPSQNLIRIFPFLTQENQLFHLSKIKIDSIFSTNTFTNIIDMSSLFIPYSLIFPNLTVHNKYLFKLENSGIKMNNINNNVNLIGEKMLLSLLNNENIHCVKEFSEILKFILGDEQENQIWNNNVKNLLIINLKHFDNFLSSKKFEKLIPLAKYHLITSSSISQVLDFLKNYSIVEENNLVKKRIFPKLKKLIFIKDIQYEIQEIVLALEVQS